MHFIDRRLNPQGKSLENRQRFLRRAKQAVREAVRGVSAGRNIREVLDGGEVEVPLGGVGEPRFSREGGVRDMVLPGNSKFVEGDYLPRGGAGQGRSGSKPGDGAAEDAFRFVLTKEEFLDLFLDDLELPDLAKKALEDLKAQRPQRAGYTTSGSPSNISIGRTVRRAMARRIALGRPGRDEIEALRSEAEAPGCTAARRIEIEARIAGLRAKAARIPFIDPIDIRYRRFDQVPRPSSRAVMFCLMDVSGSVSEHMKDLAKRFYMLLFVFLTRKYEKVELVFVRHTDEAEEVDERTFFYDPKTGGTKVSPALALIEKIRAERFSDDWNVYVAQASDGDTGGSADNAETARLLDDVVLPAVQYYAYLEVANPDGAYDDGIAGYSGESSLWGLYAGLAGAGSRLARRRVSHRSEIFPVFHDLFSPKAARSAADKEHA